MGNIIDYIKWRGDLTFEDRSFNDVDNLILAMLSYIDFSIVFDQEKNINSISIRDAINQICNNEQSLWTKSLMEVPRTFVNALAQSNRFGHLLLSHYYEVSGADERTQIAAIQISLDENEYYIAFRGTDQSIIGWHEDFKMSYQIVKAQEKAVEYLNNVIKKDNLYRVGGHSKGGNLAVYASMMCSGVCGENIIKIYNNDGPGLEKTLIGQDRYKRIESKMMVLVPNFSVIGRLFELKTPDYIIQSTGEGIMQHDGFTWCVEGARFVEETRKNEDGRRLNSLINTWLEKVDYQEREVFTKYIFDNLESSGADDINRLNSKGINGLEKVINGFIGIDKTSKNVVKKFLKSLIDSFSFQNTFEMVKSKETIRGMILISLGLFFMQFPESAIEIIGISFLFFLIVFIVSRCIAYFTDKVEKRKKNFRALVLYLVLLGLSSIVISNADLYLYFVKYTIGISFFISAYLNLKTVIKSGETIVAYQAPYIKLRIGIFLILGIVTLLLSNLINPFYVSVMAALLVIDGFVGIIFGGIKRQKINE